ncbi:MAG: HAD family hydrolase [Firmicutes bacterium]|nr:HAD family hydrolase [Bacillota bacterium]
MKKLFVFDVDGTLLTSEVKILESTKEAMKLLQAQGHQILLASARPPVGLKTLLAELGAGSLFIGLNGALIMDGDTILVEKEIPSEGVMEALGLARSYKLSVNFYSGGSWFVEEVNEYIRNEAKAVNAKPELADLDLVAKNSKVHKVLVIGHEPDVPRYQKELQAKSPLVNASISLSNYCEIVSNTISKATALKEVCNKLGVSLTDTVAFGDGENDLEMLKLAGISVAMGNAHPALLEQADHVTLNNNEDGILAGVRWVLEQIGGRE